MHSAHKRGFISYRPVQGFTLVELLIVITVIAILSMIGMATYSGVQKNARDARRKADINAIADAIEGSRAPGATNYGKRGSTTLPLSAAFGGGVVPSDTTTSKYCIVLVPTDDPTWPNFTSNGAGWPSTSTCPDANYWGQILSTGYPAPDDGAQGAIQGWHVCARLESSTGPLISNGLQVYCRSSQQ